MSVCVNRRRIHGGVGVGLMVDEGLSVKISVNSQIAHCPHVHFKHVLKYRLYLFLSVAFYKMQNSSRSACVTAHFFRSLTRADYASYVN